jgi:addiction module HigA family antidote
MTVTAFAKHIRIGRDRLSEIIHGRRRVPPDTAMCLSRSFRTSAQFWLNAQIVTDLYQAQKNLNMTEIEKIQFA